jgi:hypothetical protein
MSFVKKIGKSVKKSSKKLGKNVTKTTKKLDKKSRKLANDAVDTYDDVNYRKNEAVLGKKKANKIRKNDKKMRKKAVKTYNKVSDTYDRYDNKLHNYVRHIPIVGRQLDEGLLVADHVFNPISGLKNIADTVSGKQNLSTALINEYAGDEDFIYERVRDNINEEKKKSKRKKKSRQHNSKTIEKDRRRREKLREQIFF